MTPEDARRLIQHSQDWPRRCRRYVLEGGRRCQWKCEQCEWRTEAETVTEAREKLLGCPVLCGHFSILRLDYLPMPPSDFR